MQLAPIATTPAPAPTAPATDAPTFSGGIDFAGGTGRFAKFAAHATTDAYGEAAGYGSLQQAVDALTLLTVGSKLPAAGVFERDGRFYGRRLDNAVTFATGATWSGSWRLEQYPADHEVLDGSVGGTVARAEALKAVVDGSQRIDVSHLPVAGAAPTR